MNPVDILRMLSLAAIWGASFLFMRVIAPVIGTIPTAFFRVSIAAVGLLVILGLMRISWDFKGKLKTVMLLGMINSGIPATLYSVAAQVLPAGYSAIFNATTPLMGVLIGGLFFHEKLTAAKLGGVFLGLFGVGILTRAGPVAFNLELLMGALACLMATTCYGFAGFLARRWLDHAGGLDSRLSALGSMLGATLLLLPLFGYNVISQPPASWGGWNVWLSLLGLGLVCTAFAYIIYFRLLTSVGPVKSMTVTFMIPPFGVLWGALLLDEPLSMAHLYGGVLIAVALWLVLKPAVVKTAEVAAR
ncbi:MULTISPECIES: EamA family transporter [Gammaproteobacteria]|uniref:EamA family transporter n=1 Tax=Gammaproteobacteria TaxID=1236 RepID=UPI00191297CD|nr:EamA family transporter [Bacillus sp. TH86]MBK5308946.1 EamA family transporter [Pseudomonas sp. TH71]MBK5314406.1 EamA family transporter [Erwinia sp. TH79]MBK5319907.1 EamA family transporter [Bacillus sp. TH59]MBK5334857.1 EamA family transporter [Bacillus sp. TH57]MBK5368150.1 EamA family transporter [Pseudomonas sp. TH40]MBK5379319.1 EamA family transporter [Pseudomonas sp. TH35]MBK5384778.1 EamA family transporter [Pseudomonas sp. TH38]MBK5402073.1 EamA family transporter [Pseudomo